MHERYCIVILKEIIIESFAVTDMAAVTSAVLFRSESKGSSFHANDHPYWTRTNVLGRAGKVKTATRHWCNVQDISRDCISLTKS